MIAIDIGKRVSGVATFAEDGELICAVEIHAPPGAMARALASAPPADRRGDQWVAERMVDYQSKGARAAALGGLRLQLEQLRRLIHPAKLRLVRASAWKGNVPKDVCFQRIAQELARHERARVYPWPASAGGEGKEAVDAVGIGLFVLGRLGRGMTRKEGA